MSRPDSVHWQTQGCEPDYRFSLANERTFLAWIRTALAVLGGGLVLHQFGTGMRPQWFVSGLSIGLTAMAAVLALGAYLKWKGNEIAMRNALPLPRNTLVLFMALASATFAIAAGAMLIPQ